MKLNHFFIFAGLYLILNASLCSADMFQVEPAQFKNESLKKYLTEVENALPKKIQDSIRSRGTIQVQFTQLGQATKISPPPCTGEKVTQSDLSIYARHTLFGSSKKFKIELNQYFLDIINQGERNAQTYACGHKNLYQLAVGTLIHEVAHIYDLRTGFDEQSAFAKEYREELSRCQNTETSSQECNYYRQIRSRISDTKPYLKTIGWTFLDGRIQKKTKYALRTPDPYEFENQYEHFAVNMEFFLLDPEYKCRRPSLYQFFSKEFQMWPHQNFQCETDYRAVYSFTPLEVNLDPKRIYQIHYLLASKGQDLASKFGHTMFRIIGCAPQHEVGPDCLKDVDYHTVISFRANILDLVQNNIDGLLGGYPSQLFLYPFFEILSEYTIRESRNLLSYPIKLSSAQKTHFIERTLETYWQYSGDYFFLSNNCATESAYLLQSTLLNNDIINIGMITPYGLADRLTDLNLIDPKIINLKNAKGTYFFSSFDEQLQNLLNALNTATQSSFDVDNFQKMNTSTRKEVISKLIREFPQSTNIILAAIIAVELKIKEKETADLQGKVVEIYNQAKKGMYPELYELMLQHRETKVAIQPWKTTVQGYGIAPMSDRILQTDIHNKMNEGQVLSHKINKIVESIIPNAFTEGRAVISNINEYLKALKNTDNKRSNQ